MQITLEDTGRRYNQEWIFRHLDYTFVPGTCYAVLGPNGSGKSTLLKVLSGSLSSSEGTIRYMLADKAVPVDEIYKHLTVAAPYMDLIEEFTLSELLHFHFKYKAFLTGFDKARILHTLGLAAAEHKEIKHFSSGMKQRLKLVLALCSASNLVLLDEPTSNLDTAGEAWYLDLVAQTKSPQRTLFIGSNQEKEYGFCEELIHIQAYKAF